MGSTQAVSGHLTPAEIQQVPRVILARGLPEVIYRYVDAFCHAHRPDLETGGMLTGRFRKTDGKDEFLINGFIGAGPNADFSPESVLFDGDYQSHALELIRRQHPDVGNMGCIHLHPDKMDVCSQGDWLSDVEAVRISDTKALVFGIITMNNPRLDPLSLWHRNFKFDFFVLSQASGFRYVHVRPVVEDQLVIPAPTDDFPADEAPTAAPGSRHYARWPRVLKNKKRLVAEVRAMEERYGGRASLRFDGTWLYWEYTVVESGRRFPIHVRYPRRYPFEPPRIFSLLPLPFSPHQMPGNELCWTNRLGHCEWNPARDTAAICIHAAHRWFACLLVYLTLGRWPTEADDEFR